VTRSGRVFKLIGDCSRTARFHKMVSRFHLWAAKFPPHCHQA